LIAASDGEGFGLPLIEAARRHVPIIARDIPVFREVAGEHAYYYSASKPEEMTQAIEAWLALYQQGTHPRSDQMPWLTWKESAQSVLKTLLN
jgi:glycosyltransferase involved in cell wall biosynthesis